MGIKADDMNYITLLHKHSAVFRCTWTTDMSLVSAGKRPRWNDIWTATSYRVLGGDSHVYSPDDMQWAESRK